MIGSVHDGAHFVLAYAGADDGIHIRVEDPGYPNKHYAVDQIDGWVKLQIAAEEHSELQADFTRKSAAIRAYEDQSAYPESAYAEPTEYGARSSPAMTSPIDTKYSAAKPSMLKPLDEILDHPKISYDAAVRMADQDYASMLMNLEEAAEAADDSTERPMVNGIPPVHANEEQTTVYYPWMSVNDEWSYLQI